MSDLLDVMFTCYLELFSLRFLTLNRQIGLFLDILSASDAASSSIFATSSCVDSPSINASGGSSSWRVMYTSGGFSLWWTTR